MNNTDKSIIIRNVIFSSLNNKYFSVADIYIIVEKIKKRFGIELSKKYMLDYIDSLCESGLINLVPYGDDYAFHFTKDYSIFYHEEYDITR